MSDPGEDPATRLLADVTAFNAWRRANPRLDVPLTDADLRGADLRGALLMGAHMQGCRLDDADLRGAVLSGAALGGASLRRADLRDACFGCADLIEAGWAGSPPGAALVRGAELRGASLAAARAGQASFREAHLGDTDLTDCDLRGADLRRSGVDPARAEPPADDDHAATLARLAGEPAPVRDGLGLFAIYTFLAGDRNDAADLRVADITAGIGLSEDDIDRLMPRGPVALDVVAVAAPASDWARRVYFGWMCEVAATTSSKAPTQVQVLGHFGASYGMSERAMARIIATRLGIPLRAAG